MALKTWIGKGVWAISDQVVFGAANFLLNLYAADKLLPEVYGAFAVSFAVYILALGVYNAIIIEPLLVYGSSDYEDRFTEYLGLLTNGHFVVALAGTLVFLTLWIVMLVSGSQLLATTFLAAAVSMPFTLAVFFARHACYVPGKPYRALEGGVIYLVIMLGSVFWLNSASLLTTSTIFFSMGVAGLCGSLWIFFRLKVRWVKPTRSRFRSDVLSKHWSYGKWAVPTRLPQRIPGSAFLIMLGSWGGLSASGVLQALLNLIRPANQLFAALGVLIIASLAKIRGTKQFFRTTQYLVVVIGVMALGYALVMRFFGSEILALAYPNADYAEYSGLLWIMGLVPIGSGVAGVFSSALRAAELPDWVFWAYLVTCCIVVPCAAALIFFGQITGAAWSYAIAAGVPALVMGLYFLKLKRRDSASVATHATASP